MIELRWVERSVVLGSFGPNTTMSRIERVLQYRTGREEEHTRYYASGTKVITDSVEWSNWTDVPVEGDK